MINRTIDGYEITQEIGRGNAAAVYVARQQPVGRYVAIKVFDHLTLDSTARLRQLFDQVEAIDHVNILPVYDSGSIDDRAYWVMRYMPAGSLPARSRVPLDQIDRWLAQIAAALDYAHQHDLIHGSLKPSNVLLDHAGNAFVCDFGLAQILGSSPTDYAVPEQRRDFKPDVRSDVYALGALTYELLTGRPPIDLRGREADRLNWRVTLPPLPSSINAKLPPAIDAAVMKTLAIDPIERYASASEFAEAFIQARGTAESTQAEVQPLEPIAVPTMRRVRPARPSIRTTPGRGASVNWRWLAGGIIGLLILIGLISTLSAQPQSTGVQSTNTPAVIAQSTSTLIPTVRPAPSLAPTSQPVIGATQIVSVSTSLTLTPTTSPTPTSTLRSITPTRILFTPTPTMPLVVQPFALLMPRRENRSSLSLLFTTHVSPDDVGPIGTLSMVIPPIEPFIVDRLSSQVGSGHQTLQVSVSVTCSLLFGSITTQEILLIIQDAQGRAIYVQPMEYVKRWCP